MGTSPNQDDLRQLLGIHPIQQKTTPNQDDIRKILGIGTITPKITPIQQVIPTQPEEQKPSILQWGAKAITEPIQKIDRPGTEFSQQMRTGYRAILGVLPKVADVKDAFYDNKQRTPYFRNLLNKGLMPTEAKILNELGQEEGQKFIDDLRRTFKSVDPFSAENTRMSRGEMGSRSNSRNFFRVVGEEIANVPSDIINPEAVTVPTHLAANLFVPGIGGKIGTGIVKGMVGKEGAKWVENMTVGNYIKKIAQGDFPIQTVGGNLGGALAQQQAYLAKTLSKQVKGVIRQAGKEGIDLDKVWAELDPKTMTGIDLKKALAVEINKRYAKKNPARYAKWKQAINGIKTSEFDNLAGGVREGIELEKVVTERQDTGVEYAPTGEEIRAGKKPIVAPVRGAMPSGTTEPITQVRGVEQVQPLVEPSIQKPTFTPKTQAEKDAEFDRLFPDITEKPVQPLPEQAVTVPEKEHDIIYFKIGDRNIEVIKNPTNTEFRQISKEYKDQWRNSTTSGVRSTIDQNGNKYIWNANNVHSDIEPLINKKYGVITHQSEGMAEYLAKEQGIQPLPEQKAEIPKTEEAIPQEQAKPTETLQGEVPKEPTKPIYAKTPEEIKTMTDDEIRYAVSKTPDQWAHKDLPSDMQRLYDSPVRRKGFEVSSQKEIDRYVADVQRIVTKYKPELAPDMVKAITALDKGDISEASKLSEYALSAIHKELYKAGIDAKGLSLEHGQIIKEAQSRGIEIPENIAREYPNLKPKAETPIPEAKQGDDIIFNTGSGERKGTITLATPDGRLSVQPDNSNQSIVIKLEELDLTAKKTEPELQIETAKKSLDDFVNANAEEVAQNVKEKEPSGGLSIRKVKTAGGALPKEPPIADRELAETLTTGEKSNIARAKESVKRYIQNGMRILTAEFEPKLLSEAKEYPDAIPQFRDNVRTELIPIGLKATEASDKALYGVWGDVTGSARKYLMRMIGLRALKSRKELGLSVSRDISLDKIQLEIDNLTSLLQKLDDGKVVLERVERFKDLMRKVAEDLVARGKLKPEVLDAQDYYFPFTPQEYFQNYTSLPRKAQKAFRAYTLNAKGTVRDVVMNEDAARVYVAQVHMDDMIDDFVSKNLKQFDVYEKTLKSKTDDELKAIFHNDDFNIKPNNKYNIDGKWYTAYQEQPGNAKYQADMVNVKKLVEEDIPDIISQGENIPDSEILARLESLRKGLAVGAKYKSYLIPTPMAERLSRLKVPSGDEFPGYYDAQRLTRIWKGVTLNWAGLPYHTLNLAGDLYNVYMTSAGALKYLHKNTIPRILRYAQNPTKYGSNYLTPFEQDVYRIATDKDVMSSGFISEWRSGSRPLGIPGRHRIQRGIERFNFTRESIPRLMELAYQWERHLDGKGFVGPQFKNAIKGLDPESAAAYIARNATVDYRAVPEWYRRNMNGLLFPFLTWSQKNIINLGRYAGSKEGSLLTLAKVGLPFAAAYAYNNSGERKYIYDRLGYFQKRSSTLVIKGEDLDNDGKPEQAWIFSPQTPWDSATEIMGFSSITPLINQVQRGVITPKRAAEEAAYQIFGGALGTQLKRMTTPIIQFFVGVGLNKDPVDNQPIIPENLRKATPIQKMPYYANYFLEKVVSPFGQYIRQADKGEATDVAHLFSKGPFDWIRALGVYKVNLVANEAKEIMSLATKEEAQRAYYLTKFKKAYIEDDSKKMTETLRDASDKGYILLPKSLSTAIKSETVQIKVLLRKMQESDESNYISDMIDDMIGDSKIKGLLSKIKSPAISKEQRQDYQNTLDAMLYKDALKMAIKQPTLMKKLMKSKEPANPERRKSIGHPVGLEYLNK